MTPWLLLALITSGEAATQVVDTLGGTSSDNSGNLDVKLNRVQVTAHATLQSIEVWAEAGGWGDSDVTYVVYEHRGGDEWDLIWEAGDTINGTLGWQASPPLSLALVPGETYAIGMYLGWDSVEYYWASSSTQTLTWGQHLGGLYTGNGSLWSRPDPLDEPGSTLGYRQRLTVEVRDDLDNDGFPEGIDCDENNPAINPGVVESCDGTDENCDGVVDDDVGYANWWPDADGDGFGALGSTAVSTCDGAPADHVDAATDCDDTDNTVHPDAVETCDERDEDCDGATDEDVQFTDWWPDADGDGFGALGTEAVSTCDGPPANHIGNATDCDDATDDVFPGAPERCNSLDDNCDGTADEDVVYSDWWPDADGDGFGSDVMPPVNDCIAPEGHTDNTTDCDDSAAEVNPEAVEACNGIDDDCDGLTTRGEVDLDLDGVFACEDCDDDNAEVFPGAVEVCDGLDRDCDGTIPTEAACDPYLEEAVKVASGCGCSSGSTGVHGGWVLLGLLAGWRRRRRP